jgi:hypothetical protein
MAWCNGCRLRYRVVALPALASDFRQKSRESTIRPKPHSSLHYLAVSVHRRVPAIGLGPQRAAERIHAGKMRALELPLAERRSNSPPLGSSHGPIGPWYKRTWLDQDAGAEHAGPLPFPSPLPNLCGLCASAVIWLNSAENCTLSAGPAQWLHAP